MDMNFDDFPYLDNIDVQKTQTNFDYNLWGANTELYLSHIDAKFTSSYEHVLKFNTKAEKDAYFKTNAPIKLNTAFLIKPDGVVRLQIPYANLINYNYLVAVYPDIPALDYNPANARNEYYYFIEDCKMISPNTTELKLTLDVWNTYIDDITIEYMMLERGHYPMTLATVDEYLANPLAKRVGFTTADVNFGELVKVNVNHSKNLMEGTKWMIVATTSDPLSMPELATNTQNGSYMNQNGLIYMAIEATNWHTFCTNVADQRPQFFQTIKGIIVGYDGVMAVDRTTPHQFCGVNFYYLTPSSFDITYKFTKEDFGFDDKYKELVKLYTYPYSVVEWVDVNGVVRRIKYEDLVAGQFCLKLFQNLCISNPSVTAIVMGVGGSNAELGGNYHQQEYMCEIPLATAILNQTALNDYLMRTHFTRIQQRNEINTNKENADRSVNLAYNNAARSIDTAETIVANRTNITTGYITQNAAEDLRFANALVNLQNEKLALDVVYTNNMNNAMKNIKDQVGAVSFLSSGTTQMIGAVSNLNYSPILNAEGVATGSQITGAGGLVTSSISAAIGGAAFMATINLTDEAQEVINENNVNIKNNQVGYNAAVMNQQELHTLNKASIMRDQMVSEAVLQNTSNRANISDAKSVGLTNNAAVQSVALAGIQSAIDQAALGNNISYGAINDVYNKFIGSQYTIQYHIKTQDDHAIKLAGDQFLRYGYMFNGEVDFTTFLIMPEFTYWKVSDVWMNSDKVNSKVINTLTDILKKGVTVWGKGYYNPGPKSSYGTLTYIKNGETISYEIIEEYDFINLCTANNSPNGITFTFDTIHRDDVIGWKFNTSPNTLVPDIIPDNFLSGFVNLNSDIQFPDNVIEIGYNFLAIFVDLVGSDGNFNSNIIFNDNLTKIGDGFLYNQKNFNKPISIPNVTTIGDYFLYRCTSFNQPISLPKLTTIGDWFMTSCVNFNQNIYLPNITTVGDHFLASCISFNQPISFPNVTSIGDRFLSNCSSFNQPISLPNVISIDDSFLYDCESFNQPISLPELSTIGNSFMYSCDNFDQTIDLPNVTTIGNSFLVLCESFNHSILLPNVITIGNDFMNLCVNFNQPISFPKLTAVGNYFLSWCELLNQPISIPKLTTISSHFLYACDSFNQPISFPELTTIGNAFMHGCDNFNQTIELPNVTTIGDRFLINCYSFNQPISLPNVISIGDEFMHDCISFNQDFIFSNILQHVGDKCFYMDASSTDTKYFIYTSTLTINCDPNVFENIIVELNGESQSLSFYWCEPNSYPIKVNGIYADEFKARFPNYSYIPKNSFYYWGRNFI